MPIIPLIFAGKGIPHDVVGGDQSKGKRMKRTEGTSDGREGGVIPLDRVVEVYRIPRRTIRALVREGLLELEATPLPSLRPEMVERVRLIMSLRRDLGVNMAGVEVILRLRHQLIWTRARTAFCDPWMDVPE